MVPEMYKTAMVASTVIKPPIATASVLSCEPRGSWWSDMIDACLLCSGWNAAMTVLFPAGKAMRWKKRAQRISNGHVRVNCGAER
jgi:hypothetical protein